MRLSLIVALLASTLTVPMAFAQDGSETRTKYTYAPAQESTTRLAPTVGLTMNQLTSNGQSSTNDTGFIAGLAADMGSSDTVFHTGAMITQLNTKDSSSDVILSNLYLLVPAQGKTYFGGGQEGVFMRYGANVNILLSSKLKKDGASVDAKSAFNTLDLQGVVGLGLAVQNLEFDFSFNRSLISVARESTSGIYNQTLMLNAGITL